MAQQQQPPQQPGTPPAPQQAQGNGPNMSQMVMQMMAQLTQGQAQLSQAMTEAMNQQLQINRNVERSVEYKDRSELKGIPKPDKFTGASGTWDSWWYKFKTWVESCHKNAVKIVAQVESQCDKEITESGLEVDFDEGAELVSAQARQALISLTEGEALEIVKNTSRGSHFGLEAMRRLLCKYDPQNPQANSALLKKVLHPSQCSLDKLREGLESWENLKRKYEDRRKKPLEDDICRSCLQQMCPNKLQDHLDLQASRLTTYDQVKAEVLAYLENVETRKEAKSGAVPMDVDSLAKGKGKGKHDKGKGKGKSKGKDKGKSQSSSWSNNSYHKGSWNNQSWNQQSWYKQNTNDSKSKGKGKKGQDKGKGKGDQGKGRKVANVESDTWAQEQPAATSTGDQPEPELTALFTLEDAMPPKSEAQEESPRRGRSPRRATLQAPSRSTVTRSAMVMAQSALASASGSNKELFSKMIAQAESAVKDAQDKGLQANQALKERQETLDKLKKEAAQHQKEAKEAMAKVRAEGRAASAPAAPSRRLQADLDAGVHARAAKKAEKSRKRAASHRAATAQERTASFKNYELATHGQANPDKWDREDIGDLPEPPKARKLEPKRHRGGHHRSERRRADEARKKANEDKMKEMSKEGIPQWIHDKFEISSEETTDECEFANRLEKLKTDPEVLSRLDNVLKEAYEKVYGEIPTSEEAESDELPYNQEPAPGMEDVVHHWETSSRELMSFKELHEKSKTVSNKGHPYVKCQACGKALNSMSLASFWQHVESKNCYPQHALEFWKKEHFRARAEREAKAEGEASKKRPMDDAEAKDEKKRQEIAKDEEKKKRKQHLEEHYERFRHQGKDDLKPEVKKIPKRPEEKEKERSEKEDDKSSSRAPIELKSISPSRAPQDSRADSAQASKGKGMLSTGAKRFLEKAVREAANFVERKARKKKEKSPSPKLREHSPGGGVRSDSNLDFLGSLASPVDTIVWATVDSGAATSCLPKEMAQSLELAMTPVDEKPFTNASGQPVQVHGICNPIVTMGEKGGPQVKGVGQFRAMDVAKPLLSVSKLVEKGWTVTFGPKGSFLQRGAKKVPITMTGGVFKIAMDFHGQPIEGLKA